MESTTTFAAADPSGTQPSHYSRNIGVRITGIFPGGRAMLRSMGLSDVVRHKLLALVMLLWCLSGCASLQATLSALPTKPTLVIVVGGLGYNQLGELREAVAEQCPQATVVSAGGWDAYKADIKAIATAQPHERIIFVGHSLGCAAISQAAAQIPQVDLAVFVDPSWDDFQLSKTISRCIWYQRSERDIEREAQVAGADTPKKIKGGHNSIPHSPELIAEVVAAINTMKSQDGVRTASAGQP